MSAAVPTRGETREKWYVLAWLGTLGVATCHCIVSVSAVEYELIDTFDLSDSEFALYTSIPFGCGFIAIAVPYLIGKLGLYCTTILAAMFVFVGHLVFLFGISLFLQGLISISSSLGIQYFGRIVLGIGHGVGVIVMFTITNIWFRDNKWLKVALICTTSTYDLAMLTIRYFVLPLYQLADSLLVAFSLGLALAFIAVIAMFMIQRYDALFIKRAQEEIQSSMAINTETDSESVQTVSTMSLHIQLDSDLRKVRHFDLKIWLSIVIVVVGWSFGDTFLSQFTLPFMIYFDISEDYANILLSISGFGALTLGLFWGYVISKYGYLSYYLISSNFLLLLGMIIMGICGFILEGGGENGIAAAWIVIFCYVIGVEHYYASSFAAMFMVTPLEYTSIVNSISGIIRSLTSLLEGYLFGVLVVNEDGTKNYNWSIFMLGSTALIGLCAAIWIHIMDIMQDGPLHKGVIRDNPKIYDEKLIENSDAEKQPLLSV